MIYLWLSINVYLALSNDVYESESLSNDVFMTKYQWLMMYTYDQVTMYTND